MPLLEIRDLVKAFRSPDGTVETIIDVTDFTLEEGEHVALEGQSGSGKTTLLNLIAGILRADAGSIVVDGQDVAKLGEVSRDAWRARTIGYVFQTFNLMPGFSALENVTLGMSFGRGADKARAKALLERLGLGDRMGYRPRQLSVGQQQRVALARALGNRPKLVLADEPTGNLDARRSREALDMIRGACREEGAALLLVSHEPEVLGDFERVVRLTDINRAASEVEA